MATLNTSNKKVRKLNQELLGPALGFSESGLPIYAWHNSDELLHWMRLVDDTGKPIYDHICPCGTNVRVHSSTCILTTLRPRYAMRKLIHNRDNTWIICRWRAVDRQIWDAVVGDAIPYPSRGEYFPVSVTGGGYAELEQGELPTRDTTYKAIASIRQSKEWEERTDINYEAAREEDRRHKAHVAMLADRIGEVLPLYDRIPGQVDGPVSMFSDGKNIFQHERKAPARKSYSDPLLDKLMGTPQPTSPQESI